MCLFHPHNYGHTFRRKQGRCDAQFSLPTCYSLEADGKNISVKDCLGQVDLWAYQ